MYFVILECDMTKRVLWRHGGQEVDVSDPGEIEFLLEALGEEKFCYARHRTFCRTAFAG